MLRLTTFGTSAMYANKTGGPSIAACGIDEAGSPEPTESLTVNIEALRQASRSDAKCQLGAIHQHKAFVLRLLSPPERLDEASSLPEERNCFLISHNACLRTTSTYPNLLQSSSITPKASLIVPLNRTNIILLHFMRLSSRMSLEESKKIAVFHQTGRLQDLNVC